MAWVVPKVPTYGQKSSGEINLENIFLIGQSNVLQEQKKKNIYIYIYLFNSGRCPYYSVPHLSDRNDANPKNPSLVHFGLHKHSLLVAITQ